MKSRSLLLPAGLALALLGAGCERERRRFDTPPLPTSPPAPRAVSLRAGPASTLPAVAVAADTGGVSASAPGATPAPAMAASMARADASAAAASAARAGLAPPPGFEENAFAVAQGKRWYRWFNCNGCHANGGGDSGPPLMDGRWRYGGETAQIVATLRQGRPNGMPSFEGRLTEEQFWQLAAYVRSMSGQLRTDVAPGRSDGLSGPLPEQRRDKEALAQEAPPAAR